MRRTILVAALAGVAACSGSDGASVETTAPAVVVTLGATAPPDTTIEPETTPPPSEPSSVAIELRVDDELTELTGELSASTDPFGDFVSCSGLRSTFGTYSVLVSTTSGEVRAVSVITTGEVASEGIHDAAVRVERDDGTAIDATGTITLLPGLQAGSFAAFDASGTAVEGSFACTGTDPPEPIAGGSGEAPGVIEVFALLRSQGAERLLGFAANVDATERAECATSADPLILVNGDPAIGAITEFALSAGPDPTIELRAGSVDYSFDDVTLGDTNTAGAGSFSGSDGTVSVDGAYRCS